MPGKVKVDGVWKSIAGSKIKVDGAWKDVAKSFTKVDGAWKQWYSSEGPVAVIIAGDPGSPYVHAYEWTESGPGVKYANPASLPNRFVFDVDINSNNSVVAFAGDAFGIHAYQWTPSGFGVKYASPSGVNEDFEAIKFYPGSTNDFGSIAIGSRDNAVHSYTWSNGFGPQSSYTTPARVQSLDFNPAVGDIYIGTTADVLINSYDPFSGVGSSKSSWAYEAEGLSYNQSQGTLAFGGQDGSGILYNQNSNGFGSLSLLPSGPNKPRDIEFSNVEFDYAIASDNSFRQDMLTAYYWIEFTHTKYANPASIPDVGDATGVDFSPSGTEIAVLGKDSPHFNSYSFTPFSGFGSKFADPTNSYGWDSAQRLVFTN